MEILNALTILISVLGIVHILQEKFLQLPALKGMKKWKYYLLRGSIALFAACLPIQFLFPVSEAALIGNASTAVLTTTIGFLFD